MREPQTIAGPLAPDYLRAALVRAGVDDAVEQLETKALTGGRTGARVVALRTSSTSRYVLKILPTRTWRDDATGVPGLGESALWLAGLTRELPRTLGPFVLDVARHREEDAWWVLMRDVAAGIVPRGEWGEAETLRLYRAIAPLHARYWERQTEIEAPVPDVVQNTRMFASPLAVRCRGPEARSADQHGWIDEFLGDFAPLKVLLEPFLELLGPADADFYADLAVDPEPWLGELARLPRTLNHGDLRRANISFAQDRVTLIDWEFAAWAPAACDLQWHDFLSYWAYPPDDGKGPEDRTHLNHAYLDALESSLGRPVDRESFARAWDLGFLRVLVQLGCCLADPAVGDDVSAERRRAVQLRCKAAIARARRIRDSVGA